jgi:hypothetical protein
LLTGYLVPDWAVYGEEGKPRIQVYDLAIVDPTCASAVEFCKDGTVVNERILAYMSARGSSIQ